MINEFPSSFLLQTRTTFKGGIGIIFPFPLNPRQVTQLTCFWSQWVGNLFDLFDDIYAETQEPSFQSVQINYPAE